MHVYRPEIDGLRAVAVLSVVLFHLDVGWIRGGYVGVDVFFVLSGFLITGIIRADLEANRFSIVSFYDRRIRRILPALFAMMLIASMVSVAALYPPEIVDFGKSAIAAVLFVSNVFFYQTTDYFTAESISNPLLHTWSLSVEEQFYIFFPLLLFALRRVRPPVMVLVLGCTAVLSLAGSEWLVRHDQPAAFYLAPARAWELLLGSLLAFDAVPRLDNSVVRELAMALGVALIVASIFLFYRNMPFPGLRALAPCIGTALVIQGSLSGDSAVSRLLSLKPVVFVGLISYSLYLWHWPLIVFVRLGLFQKLEPSIQALLFMLSMSVATFSWWLVERPFRTKTFLATPVGLRIGASVAASAVLLAAATFVMSHGLAQLVSPNVVRLASYLDYDDRPVYRRGACFLDSHKDALADFDDVRCLAPDGDRPVLLLVGDSHAAHLWKGLQNALGDAQVLQATASGCKPILGTKGNTACLAVMSRALDGAVGIRKIDAILLAARWAPEDIAPLVKETDVLAKKTKVFVVGPIVEYDQALPRLLAHRAATGSASVLVTERQQRPREIDHAMKVALEGHAATFLSSFSLLCTADVKAPCFTETSDHVPIQWDYGHLTEAGATFITKEWAQAGQLRLSGRSLVKRADPSSRRDFE